MTSLRFNVVEKAFQAKPQPVAVPDGRPSEYFGKYVFNREKMFKYLPSTVYARLVDAMDNGAPMDRDIADEVAAGMKRWASELGVPSFSFHRMNDFNLLIKYLYTECFLYKL